MAVNIYKEELPAIIEKYVAAGGHTPPGCAIGILEKTKGGDLRKTVTTFGKLTYDEDSPQVTENTLYDVASVTKSVVTATVALRLSGARQLLLHNKISYYLPNLKTKKTGQLTVFDLLTSRIDFGITLSKRKHLPAQQILETIFDADWYYQQNSVTSDRCLQNVTFVNPSFILLGMILEEVTNQDLPQLAQEHIFIPRKMKNSYFFGSIAPNAISNIAPTEIDAWRNQIIQGVTHDESAWKLHRELNIAVGSAGLFTTVTDLLNFCQPFVQDPNSHSPCFTNQLEADRLCSGLGWELNTAWMRRAANSQDPVFGKSGYTGCMLAISPKQSKAVVLLTNATFPHRPNDRSSINQFRQDICSLIFGSD